MLKGVLANTASLELRAFIVWLPMRGRDDASAATRQSAILQDSRVTESWDGAREAGALFARRLGLRGTAWDVYLVYGRGARWDSTDPPLPTFWMHQLGDEAGADETLGLDPSRLTREVLALIEKKGS